MHLWASGLLLRDLGWGKLQTERFAEELQNVKEWVFSKIPNSLMDLGPMTVFEFLTTVAWTLIISSNILENRSIDVLHEIKRT